MTTIAAETTCRRWIQFRLRTLLLFTAALSLPLSWVPYEQRRLIEREEAVRAIEKLGGRIYRDDSRQQPAWRRWLFGNLEKPPVVMVSLANSPVSDADLSCLKGFTQLERIGLQGTHVTDAGMAELARFSQLQWLDLQGTQVTDAGLAHLASLTQLQCLYLNETRITDAGLVYLAGLTQLERIGHQGTHVTDAGMAQLWRMTAHRQRIAYYTQWYYDDDVEGSPVNLTHEPFD